MPEKPGHATSLTPGRRAQELDDRARVLGVRGHPQVQRAQAAVDEEAVHRPGHRAGRVLDEAQPLAPAPGRATTTAPATVSECPPRYFVGECTTKSAPCSSGRWLTGVANVLSTATSAPRAARDDARRCRRRPAAGWSATRPRSSRVSARIARGQRVEVGLVDEVVLQAPAAEHLVDEPVRAAVEVARQDRRAPPASQTAVISAFSAARPEANAVACPPSSSPSALLERAPRRVRRARVVVVLQVLPRRRLHERRGLVDRRDDRAEVRVGAQPGVDGARREARVAGSLPELIRGSSRERFEQVGLRDDPDRAPLVGDEQRLAIAGEQRDRFAHVVVHRRRRGTAAPSRR